MKKTNKLLSILLSLLMLLGMLPTVAFAADNAHSDHSSYITHIEAVEGNCTRPGNIEFWYCSYYTCDKCYSDEAMTQEISPADVVITPGAHSDACVGCEYGKTEKTFELFVPSEHPYYDEDDYANSGMHILTPYLDGFKFLFVGEYNGNLYAMGNETNEDGSRVAINLSEFVEEDGSVTVDSDAVEFFTYKELPNTYVLSPDNGYMTVLDGKIVVHGENLYDIDTSYDVFPQSIRFEQNTELSDYAVDKGYLFGWALNSPLILFDDSGTQPKFSTVLAWPEDENGDYIRDENGEAIDNRAHNIMLYMERCEHPNMTHTEAVEATCTEDGNLEYWYCEDCKIYFANAEATEYILLPEGYSNYEYYLTVYATGHEYGDDNYCDNCGEIWHPNATRIEGEKINPTCFEPGKGAYWLCEECGMYMDESKENEYWEEAMASKIPALGHTFNTDTGKCDTCGLENPVYTKITSLDDINEEDMYIFVAKVGDKYFVLGGLNEGASGETNEDGNEQGIIDCDENGNAIEIVPYDDGSISLLNQNYVGNAIPSEFMLDVNPDQWNFTEMGLTTVMPLLPNYCVYSFQSYSRDNTGFKGVPRYVNGEYGMWDGGAWAIDFYTTEVDENTYRDDMDGYTHAEQVARGNIDDNIAEGDLLMYPANYYSIGGAMFTLRFREYVNQDGATEYYFICGEDWALVGSGEWDPETDTIPTNDTQYAVSIYRYDVPTVDTHICDFGDWEDDKNGRTHTRTCKDTECGKKETEDHAWDKGVETKTPTCTEAGVTTYTCTVETCGATKTETTPALDHDWSDWTYDSVDSHTRYCKRECGVEEEVGDHEWGDWKSVDDTTHKMVCDICKAEQTGEHDWDNGVVTKEPTESEAGIKTYTCGTCKLTKTEPIDKLVHEHSWSDWSPNSDGTHTRSCRCNANETKDCEWDDGVVTAPNCEEEGTTVYTCTVCSSTKTETTPALDHDWSDWTDTGANAPADIHEHSCKRDGCDAKETGNHEWCDWTSTGSSEHKKTCSICSGERTANHTWDNGEVTKEATTNETGTKKYTCSGCSATKTEVISKIVCDHSWGKWEAENDETHKHTCVNGNGCEAFQRQAHEWDNGVVTTEPTETAEGLRTYTCLVCSHTKTESIAMLEHTHSFGRWISDGDNTHSRKCENGEICTAYETEEHNPGEWADNGYGTHTGRCSVCYDYVEEAHTWGDWTVLNDGSLKRTCTACDAFEEMPVLQPISDSVVNTTSEENAASAELTDSSVALFNSVLTDEEQNAVASGATVSVYLEVTDIPANEVSSSDKAAAEAVITEEDNDLDENTQIGMYLDIELFKEVTSNNTTKETQITETSNKVTITITIPEELINTNKSVDRTYRIIRVHEGKNGNIITDVIEGDFNSRTKTFTFETDKFSTYAVAYNDEDAPKRSSSGGGGVSTYTISFETSGGTAIAEKSVSRNEKLAEPTAPTRAGFKFVGWYTDKELTTAYDFDTKVTKSFTLYAKWTEVEKEFDTTGSFKDVGVDDWFYENVQYVSQNKLMNGVAEDKFAPNNTLTRAMLVTVLYRNAGEPAVNKSIPFNDIDMSAYYANAVVWAEQNGIVNGVSETEFAPDSNITREQIATIMFRYAQYKGYDVSVGENTNILSYDDFDSISEYAIASMQYACGSGLMKGKTNTTLNPKDNATRAEIAAILQRFIEANK